MANPLQNYVGLGKETSYGVEVSPEVYLPINESDGIQINKDKQFVEAILSGVQAKNKEAFDGKIEYAGGYEMGIYPEEIGYVLLSALGSVASSNESGETVVYRHIFTEGLGKPSLTVEQKIGEIVKRFAGYLINRFSIEGSAGELLTLSFEGFAKTQADATETTPTYSTVRPFNFADIVSFKIGGVDYKSYIEEFSFEYSYEGEGFYALGDNELARPLIKTSEATGSFTMYLDNTSKAIWDKFMNSEYADIEILIKGDAIGSASQYELKIYLPRTILRETSTSLSVDYNAVEVNFDGVFDKNSGKLLQIELVNLKSSY